jgi:PKD repeat protein
VQRARLLVGLAALAFSCGDGASDGDGGSSGSTGAAQTDVDGTRSTGATGEVSTGADTTGAPADLHPDAGASFYAFVGEAVTLDGSASTGALLYAWNAGDGGGTSEPGPDPTVSVTYDTPGRYPAVLTVYGEGGEQLSDQIVVTVTEVPSHAPVQSGSIVAIPGDEAVAVVSPDSDELVIIGRDEAGDGFSVRDRWDTCDGPRTVARVGDRFAVACPEAHAVQILGAAPPQTIALPRGTRPYGVIATGDTLWVSLPATGRLARIDASVEPPVIVAEHVAIDDARGVATLPDGRIAVSRWRSRDDVAELALVDPEADPTASPEIVTLAFDPKDASDTEAGGIPSYLDQILVSPIGREIAIPSLQANIGQGEYVDGNALTFETTLRGVVSYVDLGGAAPLEVFEARKHFDNRGFMAAGVFSSRGDWLFVADRGSRAIVRVDRFTGGEAGTLLDVGFAPSGLALGGDDRLLFVDAYMSREVAVYPVDDFADLPQPIARVVVPSREPLSPEVLLGKQLFNDSFDPRLAKDAYIACAHCHLDGEADRRTWDFTDRGEGMRNTISLLGRSGTGHGPIHWSANFDEVQDFEHDIRGPFGGSGLMSDRDFRFGTQGETLGDPKAGLSDDLDALAAYVSSLSSVPESPHRTADGELDDEAEAGRLLFESPALGCTTCHAGTTYTDSAFLAPADPLLHDVGTIGPASGQRLGGPLLGLDTPTLVELWNTPPYLHDGSAATLHDVLDARNPADLHGVTSTLSTAELDALVAYLLALEG